MTTGDDAVAPASGSWATEDAVRGWELLGDYRNLCGHRIFTIDTEPGDPRAGTPDPLLVLHGFPTSSFDFRPVLDALRDVRRVLLLDMLGYGLSDKPDQAYTLAGQADIVEAFLADAGVSSVALLTHDMGDTVGGELLARQAEGSWAGEVTARVVSNGSIYIEMAHLTDGQEMLLALDDARLPAELSPEPAALAASLAATLSPSHTVTPSELSAMAAMVMHADGQLLLPRLIRYITERRQNERRFTGAIETHPSPLSIVWGADDPIAVVEMSARLQEARPDASCAVLDGVGHYPMVEAPMTFAAAVRHALAR